MGIDAALFVEEVDANFICGMGADVLQSLQDAMCACAELPAEGHTYYKSCLHMWGASKACPTAAVEHRQ